MGESITERFARRSAEQAAEQAKPVEVPKTREVPRWEPSKAQEVARAQTQERIAREAPKREVAQAKAAEILQTLKSGGEVVDLNARATEAKMKAIRQENNQYDDGHRRLKGDYDMTG